HVLDEGNRRAFESTYSIRPPRWAELVRAHAHCACCHPRAYLATLRCAVGLARPGLRGGVWQLFYFAEAIILWFHCAGLGVRHIHAHHGSPPADVALLATHFGAPAGSGPCTSSLTM